MRERKARSRRHARTSPKSSWTRFDRRGASAITIIVHQPRRYRESHSARSERVRLARRVDANEIFEFELEARFRARANPRSPCPRQRRANARKYRGTAAGKTARNGESDQDAAERRTRDTARVRPRADDDDKSYRCASILRASRYDILVRLYNYVNYNTMSLPTVHRRIVIHAISARDSLRRNRGIIINRIIAFASIPRPDCDGRRW